MNDEVLFVGIDPSLTKTGVETVPAIIIHLII